LLEDGFLTSARPFRCADESIELPGNERPEGGTRGKTIVFGGNLSVSLEAMREGRLPPFYNPPGARGEDAFFGTLLGQASIEPAECSPVFHDPFNLHCSLGKGVNPRRLTVNPPPTRRNLRRFAKAVYGWVSYAPLWIHHQFGDVDTPARLRELDEGFARIDRDLAELFNGAGPYWHLQRAIREMPGQLELLENISEAWDHAVRQASERYPHDRNA
jgi:hypothetical protein